MNRNVGLTTLAAGAALAVAGFIGVGRDPNVRDYVNPISGKDAVREYQAFTAEVTHLEDFLNEDVRFADNYRDVHSNVQDLKESVNSALNNLEFDSDLMSYRKVDEKIKGISFALCMGGIIITYAGLVMANRSNP